jgi:hypothetical protein
MQYGIALIPVPSLTRMPSESDKPPEHCRLHLALSIYAQERLKPITPDRRALMEAAARQFSDASLLAREITGIQQHLGTPEEKPDDLERAKANAHGLANMLCSVLLLRDF